MNERLNISDLAGLLAEYTGKDKKITDSFLRELLVVISDALLEEGIVKVKGLGTFKVIPVEERESVHVNTGERFVIPAHSKFTFTPDKDLREQVNKPFSSFETTELNEGVVFPEEKEEEPKDEDVEEEDVVDSEPEEINQSMVENDNEPVSESASEPEQEGESVQEEEPESTPEEKSEPESEPESAPEQGDNSESEPEPEPEAESEQTPESEPEQKDAPEADVVKVVQKEPVDVQPRRTSKKINGTFVFLGLFLVACIVAGVYFFKPAPKKINSIKDIKQEEVAVVEPEPVLAEDTLEIVPDSTIVTEPNQTDTIKKEPKKPVVVKIVPDSRLTLIALEHYGHKAFWVYIYEHNKAIIDNPNNIQMGTELIVPEPELYGIDAKNPQSIAKAKAKQAEINSRFN